MRLRNETVARYVFDTVNGKTVEEVEKFLTAYNGYQCKLLEASENLGYDGYHYTYLRWAKVV